MSTRHTILATPIGDLTVVRDDAGITGVYFPHHWTRPDRTAFGPRVESGFEDVAGQLADYFAGERREFDLPLDPSGSPFQRRVWLALREIPYGQTVSYGEIARGLGAPGAARAVGLANGQNPISIIVPCHRVIGADGSLTGYGGGLPAKRWLLTHEATHSSAQLQLEL